MMLTKIQYDAMVDAFPEYMASKWPKLNKAWLCLHVYVYKFDGMDELVSMIETL